MITGASLDVICAPGAEEAATQRAPGAEEAATQRETCLPS